MKLRSILFIVWTCAILLCACNDDDTFTQSPAHLLTFSTDTLCLDTTFSAVPTPTKSFWVYNRSGDGIRCSSIRLEHGNQTGFRVNVDGVYLGQEAGFQVGDVDVRNKDSIRVFVELTSPYNYSEKPEMVMDNLIFRLESGVEQKVNLKAYSWDAVLMRNVHVSSDSVISAQKPIVIYGGLQVDSFATLTIEAGATLYFHTDAGLEVFGTLRSMGTREKNVILRGDRIDHMFDYLPYDRVSGQWKGVHLNESSYDNVLRYTDLHSAFTGLLCDSSDVSRQTLTMEASTIHNCQGYGMLANHSRLTLHNSQFTNTLNDCLYVSGGHVELNNCTLAQFYPFDANRGVALRFGASRYPLSEFLCRNTLITGYADDEMMGEPGDEGKEFNYLFENCIIRTPEVSEEEKSKFVEVSFEDVEDTLRTGRKHFAKIDTDQLIYDFRLQEISPAIGRADALTALPEDRDGKSRDEVPDIGCFEYQKEESIEQTEE